CQAQLFQSTKLAEGVGFEPRWVAPRSISSRVAHSRSEQQTPSLRPSPGSRSRQKLVGGLPRGVAVTNAVNGAGNRYFRVRLGKKFTGGRPVVRCFPDLDAAREWIFGSRKIDAILAQGPSAIAPTADTWFHCAVAERDAAGAERALVALGDNDCWSEAAIVLSRSFGEGLLARMTKDELRARTAFEAARTQQEK